MRGLLPPMPGPFGLTAIGAIAAADTFITEVTGAGQGPAVPMYAVHGHIQAVAIHGTEGDGAGRPPSPLKGEQNKQNGCMDFSMQPFCFN